jgi:ferric-dicitrate binding protein FerR (iron transport regulator)
MEPAMTPSDCFASPRSFLAGLAASVTLALASVPASAQTPRCSVTTYTDPPRQVLHCADGLTVTAEQGSAYRLVDSDRDGKPEAAELSSRALLVEASPGRRGGRFQILTPHATAAVRGTIWAVDVSPARTSVFVQQGVVAVGRPGSPDTVALRAGEGIDVDGAGGALEVKRWSTERATHLLARFGR